MVSFASERGIPVVPYGGGTGVMGAVVPVRGGIALDLRRMDRILEVSREDRTARVQPGVYLADLDSAARDHGMMLGHDPWSVPIATVGGAISTDSVGYRASRYGSMGQQVRALEVVLGSGEVVRTRPIQRQSSGPMLKGLFAGAEGTMGVITEATIDLRALPEAREFASVGFDTFEQGYPVVVARLLDIDLVPALIDLTEEPGTPENAAPCILYLGFEGYREQVEAQRTRTMAEALAAGGRDLGPGPDARVLGGAARRCGTLARPHAPAPPDRALEGAALAIRRLPPRRHARITRPRLQAVLRGDRRPLRSGRA